LHYKPVISEKQWEEMVVKVKDEMKGKVNG
jgi:hypothetical protein